MILLAGLLASSAAAFDETRSVWIRGVFTGNSPRALALAEPEAWRQAVALVERTPGAFLLIGTGRSMQPLYPAGTLLVLRAAAYTELRNGQTVVYRNGSHRAVGHVLITKARDGWRVRGLNNRTHDPEPVVAENLIGVVVGAFLPERRDGTLVAASRRPAGRAVFLSEQNR
jgi:signal peptidase I